MNAHQDGAKLRTLVANRILEHMLRRLDETEIEPELLCKLAHSFCEIRKQDIAAEKNATALEVAKVKAANKKTNSETDGYDEDAPYGRKPDGTPHTHGEFLETLDEALKDVYGFSLHDKPRPVPGLHIIPAEIPPDERKRNTPPCQGGEGGGSNPNNTPPSKGGARGGSNPTKPQLRSIPSAPKKHPSPERRGRRRTQPQQHPSLEGRGKGRVEPHKTSAPLNTVAPKNTPPCQGGEGGGSTPTTPLSGREGKGEGRTSQHHRPNQRKTTRGSLPFPLTDTQPQAPI